MRGFVISFVLTLVGCSSSSNSLTPIAVNPHLTPPPVPTPQVSHRTALGREYRFRTEEGRRSVTIVDTTPEWSREDGSTSGGVLVIRDLSQPEIDGLEEVFEYFREVREETSSAVNHVRLRHLRDGRQVGQEFYVGFSLTSRLAYYDREGMRRNPQYAHDYERLALAYRISPERLLRMVPLETLERQAPNKAPEPTPGAVTPRATEGVSK